jgi:hypothetical protein
MWNFFYIDVKLAGEIFIPPNLHLLILIAVCVCVCVCSCSRVEGSCPLAWYQPQGKFTPPNACNVIPPSDTPSASPWEDVS